MAEGRALLEHALELIRRGWTQDTDARAADATPVRPWDDRAASWSLLGALVAAVEHTAAVDGEHAAISELAHACILLADILDTDSLDVWNDSPDRSHDEVLAAIETAAAGTVTGSEHDDPSGFSLN